MKPPPVITIQPPPSSASISNPESPLELLTTNRSGDARIQFRRFDSDAHETEETTSINDYIISDNHDRKKPSTPAPTKVGANVSHSHDYGDHNFDFEHEGDDNFRFDPSQYHVDMLRAKFIGLINYKKFRLVYLLSSCYVILNLISLGWMLYQSRIKSGSSLISELMIPNSTNQVLDESAIIGKQKSTVNLLSTSGDDGKPDCKQIDMSLNNGKSFINPINKNNWNNNQDYINKISILTILLLFIVQTGLVLWVKRDYFTKLLVDQAMHLNQKQLTPRNSRSDFTAKIVDMQRKPWAHKLALLIALILLHFQVQSVTILALFAHDSTEANQARSVWSQIAFGRPRLGANLVLAYVTPLLLNPGSSLLNAIGLALLAPSTCIALAHWLWFQIEFNQLEQSSAANKTISDYDKDGSRLIINKDVATMSKQIESQLLLLVVMTPLALALGWWQRVRGKKSICEQIFTDANKLIETKVSLEAQRQQQETLLLSVLPAYVAEQVKRNMLKQVEQTHKQSQSQTLLSPSPPQIQHQHNSHQQQHSQSVVSVRECSGSGSGQPVTQLAGSANLNTLSAPKSTPSAGAAPPPALGLVSSSAEAINNTSANNTSSLEDRASSYLGRRKSSFSEHSGARQRASYKMSRSSSIQASQQAALSNQASVSNNKSSPANYLLAPSILIKSHLTSSTTTTTTSSLGIGGPQQPPPSPARRGFNELFIRTYNNVSLLYADIVGFTHLCTKLSASHLVRVLNNLFSQFDHLAEQHKIMRIKILGDCYYGVSGIPEFAVLGAKSRISHRNENHAINCVNMGLDMIDYIGCLNRELASDWADKLLFQRAAEGEGNEREPIEEAIELNMRIGIHSGHIHSGVIGLKKWQFDVWSNDVSIAMHCESSGTSGRVQVTEATIAHLKQAFVYEPSNAGNSDPFLDGQQIRTFFIIERNSTKQRVNSCRGQKVSKRSQLRPLSKAHLRDTDLDKKIRNATINTIHQTLLSVDCFTSRSDQETNDRAIGNTNNDNNSNASDINIINSNNQRPELNYHNMTRCKLDFKDPLMGRLYANRRIRGLRQELLALWFILAILVPAINWLLATGTMWSFWLQNTISQSLCTSLSLFFIHIPQVFICPDCCSRVATSSGSVGANADSPIKSFARRSFSSMFRAMISWGHFGGRNTKPVSSSSSRTKNQTGRQRTSSISQSRQRFTAGLILVLLILEFSQVVPVSVDCKQALSPSNPLQQSLGLQQTQLLLFLFLVAINCSSSLIGYTLHTALIFLLALLSLLSLPFKHNLFTLVFAGHNHCNHCYQPENHHYYLRDFESSSFFLLDWFTGLLVIIASVWSAVWARQIEFAHKADFLWRNQLSVDHEELEYISGINKILLENILPSHVVQYYLNQQQQSPAPSSSKQTAKKDPKEQQNPFRLSRDDREPFRMSFTSLRVLSNHHELYHESHQGVAVMFASIPHFYEFYDETDVSKQGLGCIALLNEIICEFDKLLLKNKFSRIEKIKTIGSTYMAVSGLRPQHWNVNARHSNASQSTMCVSENISFMESSDNAMGADNLGKFLLGQQKQNLVCMVQFATSLMQALNNINKQSFQAFKLRVGLNSGSVIAGVIGAQRPFYDIWGDTVNIASRMESLGHVGRIQVPEVAANLLVDTTGVESSYRIVKRGLIEVKGKGGMVTYFVDKRDKAVGALTQSRTSCGTGT